MKKIILNWLFGTDNVKDYMDLLCETRDDCEYKIKLLDDHRNTIRMAQEDLIILRKLIRICENHGIDVDKEIKEVELEEV